MAPGRTYLETGTTAHTNLACFAILIVEDTVFTTNSGLSGDSFVAVTFVAGSTLYGNFRDVTLASGSVILYLK
jgi:hypothetical protein